MTTIAERNEYTNNPYFTKAIYGDWSPFYNTIAVCSIFLFVLLVLNFILGCCSRHTEYWQDRHTGNRWIVSLWTATPHKQPPLDLTELENVGPFHPISADVEHPNVEHPNVTYYQIERDPRAPFAREYPRHPPVEEHVELQPKRESDI